MSAVDDEDEWPSDDQWELDLLFFEIVLPDMIPDCQWTRERRNLIVLRSADGVRDIAWIMVLDGGKVAEAFYVNSYRTCHYHKSDENFLSELAEDLTNEIETFG